MSWGIGKRVSKIVNRAKTTLVAGAAMVASAIGRKKSEVAQIEVKSDPRPWYQRERLELPLRSFRRRFMRGPVRRNYRHECARRIGGLAWKIERDLCRARRGLPPIHVPAARPGPSVEREETREIATAEG